MENTVARVMGDDRAFRDVVGGKQPVAVAEGRGAEFYRGVVGKDVVHIKDVREVEGGSFVHFLVASLLILIKNGGRFKRNAKEKGRGAKI
jgi:hypothetical protein